MGDSEELTLVQETLRTHEWLEAMVVQDLAFPRRIFELLLQL